MQRIWARDGGIGAEGEEWHQVGAGEGMHREKNRRWEGVSRADLGAYGGGGEVGRKHVQMKGALVLYTMQGCGLGDVDGSAALGSPHWLRGAS